MTTTLQPGRTSASSVTFGLAGLMNLQFDLMSQDRSGLSGEGGLHYACSHDHLDEDGNSTGPARVSQFYLCDEDPKPDKVDAAMRKLAADPADIEALQELAEAMGEPGHGPYRSADLQRGRVNAEGRFVLADAVEIAAAKTGGLDKEFLEFHVHEAADVDAACRPGKKGYLVRPAKGKSKKITPADEAAYAALRALAATPELALVGSLNLRGTRSTYRLGVWGDQMVLTELRLPSDLKERDIIDVEAPEARVAGLLALARGAVEPFDEEAHRWDVEAAMVELLERAADDAQSETPVPAYNDQNLDELIALALQAQTDSAPAA